jgi:HK97 family phage major capsid protein
MNIEQGLAEVIKNNGIIKFVDIGGTSLNGAVLQTEKLAAFIQEMKESTVLMDAARIIPMNSFSKDIDRISMDIDLESPVRDPTTGNITLTDQNPAFGVNTLNAKKLRARTRLTREGLEDNIEGNNLQTTVQSLFAGAGGRSQERIFIYGDTEETGASVPTGYKAIDGWIKKCGTKLYGTGTNKDYDPSIVDSSKDTYQFAVMLDALDPNYLEGACFFVPTTVAKSYQRGLKSRDTNLGDQANLQNGELTFEGHRVIAVPALNKPYDDPTFFGKKAMFFGKPENFVYGMWKEIEIDSQEDKDNEMYKFWIRMRSDCHFEDETKTVCALPAETKP